MIQTIVTYACPKCGSENMVRNGHDYKGDQKYHCKSCDSYGTLHAQRGYAECFRRQVKHAMLERIRLRGIERLFGISRRTVLAWIEQWVAHLPALETTLADTQLDDVLELDELWSFVLKKANKRWAGSLCVAVPGRLLLTSSATAVKPVAYNSGGAFR